jgi:hypothetical protein
MSDSEQPMSSADGPAQPDKAPPAEEKHDSLRKRLSKPAAWTGGVLTALVVAAATAFGSGAVHRLFPPAHHSAPAVTIESSWLSGCGAQYLDETPAQAVASGNYSGVPEGGNQTIEIVNQTSSTERVVITGIRISLVARRPAPASGILVTNDACGGGGGGVTPRPFSVSFGSTPPEVTAQHEAGVPFVDFPYSISRTDPEVFNLNLLGSAIAEYTFTVKVFWVAAGQQYHTTLTNDGRDYEFIGSDPALRVYAPGSNPGVLTPVRPRGSA